MAEMMQNGSGSRGRKRRKALAPIRIDFTPMVDLACLLLTFFMLTTAFTKEHALEINAPVAKKGPEQWDPQTMTVLVDESKEKIYYYFGEFGPSVHLTGVSLEKDGFRKLLFDKNGHVIAQVNTLSKARGISRDDLQKQIRDAIAAENGLKVIVKTGDKTRFETVVDVVDELNNGYVGRYTITDITPAETDLLRSQLQTATLR